MREINSKLNNEVNKLNLKQKQAVTEIDGPMLTLAGPGTGKTQCIALRIAFVLNMTDMDTTNILCLTFSNAGVKAMKERLLQLIGPEAEKINVATYHSFANSIVQSKVQAYEGKSQNKVLNKLQSYMIIEQMLGDKEVSGDYFEMKPPSPVTLKAFADLFSLLKKEAISADDIKQYAETCLSDLLPNDPAYNLKRKAELNADGKKLKDKIIKFSNRIPALYTQYTDILSKKGLYEYEDMLQDAISILQNDESKLQDLQERYQYILVDEFQDTNARQLQMLELLIQNVEKPNLFVVGDDDQTIYKFQGASQQNFIRLSQLLPDLNTIVLDTNYRSTGRLLEHSFELIRHNTQRHELKTAVLKVGKELNAANSGCVVTSYFDADQEAYAVARKIAEMTREKEDVGQIAVLARRNSELDKIKQWLIYLDIPYQQNKTKENLLEDTIGKRIYYLTMFIKFAGVDNNLSDQYFVNFMMELGHVEPLLLSYLKFKELKLKGQCFYRWFCTAAAEIISKYNLQGFISDIDQLLVKKTLQIDDEAKQLIEVAVGLSAIDERSGNILEGWTSFLGEFLETDKQKTILSLADNLFYHDQLNIGIDFNSPKITNTQVILSTIHSSKGLEYENVFVIGCENTNWEDVRKKSAVKVPKLLNQFIKQDDDDIEDLRHLIYVAATRAKHRLFFSLATYSAGAKDQKLSEIISPLMYTEAFFEHPGIIEVPSSRGKKRNFNFTTELDTLVKNKLSQFSISPSSTHGWADCQNKFFFRNICGLPDVNNEVFTFGTAVHKVLEVIAGDRNVQASPGSIPELVESVFAGFQNKFHPLHFRRYKAYAAYMLPEYLNNFPIIGNFQREKKIAITLQNGVRIKGVLDRYSIHNDVIKIVDYKTGANEKPITEFRNDTDPGSGLWRQGAMYYMLASHQFTEVKEIGINFHYVEIPKEKTFNNIVGADFENWLEQMWHHIQALSFERTCADEHCVYCKSAAQFAG
jgi:DNA helicase-2/ATP-dependent DNA helicase PcrA